MNESTIQKSILIRAQVFHDGVSRQSKINRTYKTDYDGHLGTTKRIQGITYALLSKYNILGIMRAIEGSISGLFYMLVKLKFVSLYVWKESPFSAYISVSQKKLKFCPLPFCSLVDTQEGFAYSYSIILTPFILIMCVVYHWN